MDYIPPPLNLQILMEKDFYYEYMDDEFMDDDFFMTTLQMDGTMEVHGLRAFNEGEEEHVRRKAYKLCREYLNGAWRKISIEEFVIKKVGGGLSNLLYYCALPPTMTPIGTEPPRVLLRLYGPAHEGENVLEAHFTECVVFTMLSENESGPRLYGIFPGGRLEQYIPGRALETDELANHELSMMVAEAAATIHNMSVPLSKLPNYLWGTMLRWVGQIENFLQQPNIAEQHIEMIQKVRDLNLRSEVGWLKNFLTAVRSPVVFCHNDLQEGNILLSESESGEKSIVLIDFEYCAYNYRGYDLANHFCEHTYDYSNQEKPYFWSKPHNYPTKENQVAFVKRYLSTIHNTDDVPQEEVSRLLEEIEAFVLGSHFYWALWSIVNATSSTITFDYWGWGSARLEAYFKHKSYLLNKESCIGERCAADNTNPIDLPSSLIETS